jgi:hypothetical protein
MNSCALKKQAQVFSTDTAFHHISAENITVLFYELTGLIRALEGYCYTSTSHTFWKHRSRGNALDLCLQGALFKFWLGYDYHDLGFSWFPPVPTGKSSAIHYSPVILLFNAISVWQHCKINQKEKGTIIQLEGKSRQSPITLKEQQIVKAKFKTPIQMVKL